MKRGSLLLSMFFLASIASFAFVGSEGLGPDLAYGQTKAKLAVVGKVPKEQSARRFQDLYPQFTGNFVEAFTKDGRFELIPAGEVDGAVAAAGIKKDRFNPDDVTKLRDIGKRCGADLVFVSYYYEMGGHGMPMHSNNVLILVGVASGAVVKIDKDYSRILSESELISGDATAFKELMEKGQDLIKGS